MAWKIIVGLLGALGLVGIIDRLYAWIRPKRLDGRGDSTDVAARERELKEGAGRVREQGENVERDIDVAGNRLRDAQELSQELDAGVREAREALERSDKLLAEFIARVRSRKPPDAY